MSKAILFSISSKPDYIQVLPLANLKAYAMGNPTVKEYWEILTEFSSYPAVADKERLIDTYCHLIERENPRLLAFSCYLWNFSIFVDLFEEIRNRNFEVDILVGGHQISFDLLMQGEYDDLPIRYAVIGEGEKTFTELLSFMVSESPDLSKINGLAYRYRLSDPFIMNSPRMPSQDFAAFPGYYREGLIGNEIFNDSSFVGIVETLRGCRFKCAYCTYNTQLGINNIFYRNIDDIIKDLSFLNEKNCQQVTLVDSNFGIDLDRAKELVREILRQDFKIWYYAFSTSPGFVDEELAGLFEEFIDMREGNEICVNIGLQTTNRETLKLLKRSPKIERITESVNLLKSNKIYIKFDTILGLPNDRKEDISETIDFTIDLFQDSDKHVFAPNILELLPGSALERTCLEEERNITFKSHEIYGQGSNQFYESDDIRRNEFVESLRRTAVACRLMNYEGWAKYKYEMKPEKHLKPYTTEIRDFFLETREKHGMTNIELIDHLVEGFKYELDQRSLFVNPDFPLADYWWWYLCEREISNKQIMKLLNNLSR